MNYDGRFVKTRPYSIFAYGVKNLDYEKGSTSDYISASQYCQQRKCSRYHLKVFAKKGWIYVTKSGGGKRRFVRTPICVKEIPECSKMIDDYLAQKYQPTWYKGRFQSRTRSYPSDQEPRKNPWLIARCMQPPRG